MNDVEVLSAELADQFPLFKADDIIVSLRNLSMVLIVDVDNKKSEMVFSTSTDSSTRSGF